MKDFFGYKGKKCVITGAASGMGKATTEMLVELGAEVYALDFKEVTTPGIKQYINVNLAEKESIDEAFSALPEKFDSFFGVAGVSGLREGFEFTFVVNFVANKYITEQYLSNRVNNGGSISYVASSAGVSWKNHLHEFKGIADAKTWDEMVQLVKATGESAGYPAYVISKRAMAYYTKTSVPLFAKNNIRVNSVSPGLIANTGLTSEFYELSGGKEKSEERALGAVNYSGVPQDVAPALIFLNSDMARYVSGVDLCVDYGGRAMMDIDLKENVYNKSFFAN
ncbi:NAD(P)-dependent dehydrogenase (short-subunit alcohol dehydrogenase family) [Neobacillus niacini]|uniref:SDR family oxidoreductase n=1 Tax=Neobacillus niacini TaxID=86668 RepID=UPI002861C456|nr:SDR family oxidoreductase [Neobacillus niacini]MDR7076155.1 NAD(P)-dependent dehydrogenase (short-subunit alcohol dehydrogenase family) [Neobacillus niacini]